MTGGVGYKRVDLRDTKINNCDEYVNIGHTASKILLDR